MEGEERGRDRGRKEKVAERTERTERMERVEREEGKKVAESSMEGFGVNRVSMMAKKTRQNFHHPLGCRTNVLLQTISSFPTCTDALRCFYTHTPIPTNHPHATP